MSHPSSSIEHMFALVTDLIEEGIDPTDHRDAIRLTQQLEEIGRRVDAARAELITMIEERGLHLADGHASAKTMVRHVARLGPAEAARRARAARAMREMPELNEAWKAGKIGTCQIQRLARAHSNRRVRAMLVEAQQWFLQRACRLSYVDFDRLVTQWVDLVDEDGTTDTNQRTHEGRSARIIQEFDKSWRIDGGCAALQGVEMKTVFDRFIDAEFHTDWAEAKDVHGSEATADHLPRTPAQRRFDALLAIFRRAATSDPGGTSSLIVTNVVIDQEMFERQLLKLAGGTSAQTIDPFSPAHLCCTIDGLPLDPTEVAAAALVGHVRRVVVGSDSVVIDLGRRQRLFTGSAQLAVRLASRECYWPGCHVPVSQCQTDHLQAWSGDGSIGPDPGGGTTSARNGGPACGRHNRHKQSGFTVHRDRDGAWHVIRPDGSEIEN